MKAYADYVGDETTRRFSNGRLPNVETLLAENNELTLAEDSLDAAIMILAYHDIYLVDEENGWPKIDGPALLKEFYMGLKPGGILGVVDHVAAAGSPSESGGTLHRIDPAIVVREVEAVGFILDGESDALRNTRDDHSLPMDDPIVRGQTDRFVMRFRKPWSALSTTWFSPKQHEKWSKWDISTSVDRAKSAKSRSHNT